MTMFSTIVILNCQKATISVGQSLWLPSGNPTWQLEIHSKFWCQSDTSLINSVFSSQPCWMKPEGTSSHIIPMCLIPKIGWFSMIFLWLFPEASKKLGLRREPARAQRPALAQLYHGKTMGKPWENDGKMMVCHGKTMGKWWFAMEFYGTYPLAMWYIAIGHRNN